MYMLCIAVKFQEYSFCIVCPRVKYGSHHLKFAQLQTPYLFCTVNEMLLSESLK